MVSNFLNACDFGCKFFYFFPALAFVGGYSLRLIYVSLCILAGGAPNRRTQLRLDEAVVGFINYLWLMVWLIRFHKSGRILI